MIQKQTKCTANKIKGCGLFRAVIIRVKGDWTAVHMLFGGKEQSQRKVAPMIKNKWT